MGIAYVYVQTINQINKMENNFLNKLGSSDFESWVLVQRAYKQHAFSYDIMESGFNENSGYVYIALEVGIQIASCFGQEVEYIVFNEEEKFFDNIDDAFEFLYKNK